MVTAIILAAGESTRFGKQNKLFVPILGKPLLYYTLQALHDHPEIDNVYLVTSTTTRKLSEDLVKRYHFPKVKACVVGGNNRQESFIKGFQALQNPKSEEIILIHNGANPLVTSEEITEIIKGTKSVGASAVGHFVTDTIKEISGGIFSKTLSREKIIAMQTPQAAKYKILKKALLKAEKNKKIFTDETSLLEYSGQKVKFVQASAQNVKITTIQNYENLKILMGDVPEDFLIGFGQDSHEFEQQKKGMWLGGMYLSDQPKFVADSDGDIILHALCNALSQAIGEMSLGHFATPMFNEKNIKNSQKYLEKVLKKLKIKKYVMNNIGLMLEGQHPLIDPLVPSLKKSLSALTGLSIERIGITATTGKKLTSFGQGKGLQCCAVVSLVSEKRIFLKAKEK